MVSQALKRVERERSALRGWWARERLTGTTLFLFSVRWAAWAVAAVIVILDVLPATNVDREPVLLIGTFATTAAFTLYLPLLRPRVRDVIARSRVAIDDILVLSLLDVALALGIVFLSGGWDSPYYLYALVALLVPASILERRLNLMLIAAFVASYALIVAAAGQGVDGPWRNRELNNFVVFLALPFVIAIIIQFFGWMARQLAEQRAQLERTLDENVRLQAEREELAAQEERNRLAREIHDGVAQSVYMLSLSLETAAAETEDREVSERLRELVALAKQTLLEVRHYIFDLKPLLEGQTGVASALRNQARELAAVSGLRATVDVVGTEVALPLPMRAAMYRIAQEALANVYRHAQASTASMRLEYAPGSVTLVVEDDGVGLGHGVGPGNDVGLGNVSEGGRGIQNMRQRAADLGGTLDIKSTASGTVVRLSFHLEEA